MKRAGCNEVLFGIESADENILKTIRKGITPEDMRRGVKIATDAGLSVFTSFILGLPGESPETARKSLAFANELNNNYGSNYAFHILAPLPGTELYERVTDYGLRILTRNWARYDANQPITETATMSQEMAREAMADYDEVTESAWKEVKRRAEAGDVQYIQRLQKGESQEFVWSLLQGDVIDKLGKMGAAAALDPADAEAELVSRVSRKLALPFDKVQPQVTKLVQKGLLRLSPGVDGLHWQWSASQHIAPEARLSVEGAAQSASDR